MPASFFRFFARPALLVALIVTTGCGSASTTPTTTTEPASVTQVFTGTLGLNGSAFYSFTTTQQGTISFQLKKLQRNGVDIAETITLGLGGPRNTDCLTSSSITVGASDTVLLGASQSPGTYCVRVWDAAILTAPATFSVNINRPIQ